MHHGRIRCARSLLLGGLALVSLGNGPVASAPVIPNGLEPEPGLLVGGQPSPDQWTEIAAAGYRSVLNLRGVGEEGNTDPAEVEAAGLTYRVLPITGAAGLDEAHAREFAAVLEELEKPIVVHCGSGNRVGAMLALKAFYVDGAAPEEALALGLSGGLTRLEPAVRTALGLEPSAD